MLGDARHFDAAALRAHLVPALAGGASQAQTTALDAHLAALFDKTHFDPSLPLEPEAEPDDPFAQFVFGPVQVGPLGLPVIAQAVDEVPARGRARPHVPAGGPTPSQPRRR